VKVTAKGQRIVHIHGEIVIHRPPEEVFDAVADTSKKPGYNPRMRRSRSGGLERNV
jgi:uncharacterized protein YndB with AHSA1/START domain